MRTEENIMNKGNRSTSHLRGLKIDKCPACIFFIPIPKGGERKNKMTKKKYTPKIQNILIKKMRDDFDRAKECVNFIDKLRGKKNG